MHFPRPTIAIAVPATTRVTALLFSGLSTLRTSLGLIVKPPASEELLLSGGKLKIGAALYASEGLVYVAHG
jgi:hypothetical protein